MAWAAACRCACGCFCSGGNSALGRLCLVASEKSLWQETASVLANFFGGGVFGSVCDRRLDAVKKELRQRALAARNALEKRKEKSRQIAAHILESVAYQNTERIFTFVSMGSEVETEEIIRQAWQDGKAVAVPKTEKHREMHFYEIRSLAELSEGRFGVREPKGGVVCTPKEGDLLLVPGLLFDGKKNRLGYGGGYYDTYFAKHKEGKRIGLAFAAQRFAEELPTEETDVPLDAVITENGWEE
ncbi:MAG TPA: 5-formyltetrahydrofolate cyclo-ligase [Tyzzerella sp.]|nr:5-formyltetrahydrofolate cyclo-ligase [Tyzzerella sp.]